MKHKAENYVGWYGVLAILLAYLLVSFNTLTAKSPVYQLLNLTGHSVSLAKPCQKKMSNRQYSMASGPLLPSSPWLV